MLEKMLLNEATANLLITLYSTRNHSSFTLQLSQNTGVTYAWANKKLREFESLGILTRTHDVEIDGRTVYLDLTPDGVKIARKLKSFIRMVRSFDNDRNNERNVEVADIKGEVSAGVLGDVPRAEESSGNNPVGAGNAQ